MFLLTGFMSSLAFMLASCRSLFVLMKHFKASLWVTMFNNCNYSVWIINNLLISADWQWSALRSKWPLTLNSIIKVLMSHLWSIIKVNIVADKLVSVGLCVSVLNDVRLTDQSLLVAVVTSGNKQFSDLFLMITCWSASGVNTDEFGVSSQTAGEDQAHVQQQHQPYLANPRVSNCHFSPSACQRTIRDIWTPPPPPGSGRGEGASKRT